MGVLSDYEQELARLKEAGLARSLKGQLPVPVEHVPQRPRARRFPERDVAGGAGDFDVMLAQGHGGI